MINKKVKYIRINKYEIEIGINVKFYKISNNFKIVR